MVGIAFALIATLGFGSSIVLTRLGLRYVRATTGAWVTLVSGATVSVTLALVFAWQDVVSLTGEAFLWIAAVGFLNFALGRLLNVMSVQRVGATRASPIFSVAPLVASFLAVVFLHETLSPLVLGGTLLVVAGVGIISSERVAT